MTAFRGAVLLVTDGLPVPSFNAGRQLPNGLIWVGGNRVAAHSSGISVSRTKIMTYAISGLLAAIAGIIRIGRTNLFGGEGGVWGSIIGAAIMS